MSADPLDGRRLAEDRERTLSSILDEIVPASDDGALPAAGALGLAAHFVRLVERTPELELTIGPGLEAADRLARERHRGSFAELPRAQRLEVLRALEAAHPGFVPTLVFHTYTAYYQHPRVIAALGMDARPPHPRGYEMPPDDLSLVDPVRRRPKLYRGG